METTKEKIQRIENALELYKNNVLFIKERIHIQTLPDYNPIRPITQAKERQYYQLDVEIEEAKVELAEKRLKVLREKLAKEEKKSYNCSMEIITKHNVKQELKGIEGRELHHIMQDVQTGINWGLDERPTTVKGVERRIETSQDMRTILNKMYRKSQQL